MLTEEETIRYETDFNNYIEYILSKSKIKDILKNEEINKCMEMSNNQENTVALRILVNTFNRIDGDINFLKLKYRIMNKGFILGFNINKIINKQFEEYQYSNKIRIFGYNKCDIEKYYLEISFRRKIMEKLIMEQYDEGKQIEEKNPEYDN